MLITGGLLSTTDPELAVGRLFAGHTFYLGTLDHSVPGFGNANVQTASGATNLANNSQQKLRWRASKGSAPTNRFTRAISNNTTEKWHRTMPVADTGVTSILIAASFAAAVLATISIQVEKLLQSDIAVSVSTSQSASVEKTVESSMSLAVFLSEALETVVFFLREYEEEFQIRRIFR